ncbi:MAG TPA: LuxR C-terminal-related transcriptional regulator [Streptosporangiaceae bacterium]|nr:LuxR C-terminal-related transcriptional regulator [Streptosporangiaceae bacterium]
MSNAVRDSRLTVPQLPPRHVSRPRLLAELDRAAAFPLTLLSAGPGAGKTVLLTDWVRRGDARVAWLSPAPADAEPRRFWPLLESALREAHGAGRGPSAAALPGAGVDLVQTFLSRMPHSGQLVVIVDDAHVLAHSDVLEGLDRLIRSGHPGLRLILAARSDPMLPLHRYRLAGQIHELRASDLAMTPAEITEVLAIHGVTLPARDFDLFVARTEGWVAGVRLSAMRMEGTECPADFVSELALDPGSIGEYLVNEVLHRQPERQRKLLIETSFLGEVTGPLADAVTGMAGCGDMLADLARENSFVIPLDAARERYRYHQLFAEILYYLLRRNMRQAMRVLQERAAAWFEAGGDLGNALYWAVRAGNRHYVVKLMARGGFAHAFVHRQDLSGLGLRDLLPLRRPVAASALRAAEFAVASSAIEAVFADADKAARELGRGPSLKLDEVLTDPDLLVTSDLVELVLGQKASDARAVDAAAHRLLSRSGDLSVPAMPGLRAAVLLAQASTHLWHGRHEDVGALLDEALAEAQRDGMPGIELEVLGMMAFADSYWSRTNRAADAAQRASALQSQKGLALPPALELAAVLRSLIAGELDGWTRPLQRVLLPDVVGSDPALAVALVLGQANAMLALGRVDEARIMLQQTGRYVPPLMAVLRDIMLADLETSMGRPHAALRLLRNYVGSEFAIPTAMPRARAYLALSDIRGAQECVRTVLATPSPQAGRFVLVEAFLCDAQIAQLKGEPDRALEILMRALDVARGEVVLPFLRMKDTFAALLARHPAISGEWPVPRPRTPAEEVPKPAISRELSAPLTQRELTILRLLATSMSTSEIADELCLSVNTVKSHLAAIYRKLPASRRREAVLRARQLELI